jgi:hypothetical protein
MSEASDYIKEWEDARDALRDAEHAVVRAGNAVRVAAAKLSRHLTPKGAKAGEYFSVWHGEQLVTIRVLGPGQDASVEVRRAERST